MVAALLGAYLVALGWQAWHVGLTFDEPTHFMGAYLYWLNRPDLYPQDVPPLMKILTGWIPLVLKIPLFPELPSWQHGWKQDVASDILDRLSPEQIQQLFYLMRLVMTAFPVLTALLIWYWGRQLFGRTAAMLLLLAAVLSPNALAHGCLLKNDLATTFGYLLFAYCGWRFWLDPSRRNALLLGASALLAMMAKMSLLITAPMALLLVLARAIRGPKPLRRWLPFALMAVMLVPYNGMLAAYKFEARRLTREDLEEMRVKLHFPRYVRRVARIFLYVPIPTDVRRAVWSLSSYERYGAPSYMLGEARSSGSFAYYPLALAVKIPIALQILVAGGLILAARRIWTREAVAADWFLLLPGTVYLASAMQSNLQLGLRLVSPALPFLLLLGGLAIQQGLATLRGRLGLAAIFLWLAVASVSIYPQGIAYFNEWVGGPRNGWKYLVDSNLDWGQNLPELAEYVRRNHIKHLKLFYFGFDKPHRYGLQDSVELQAPPWGPDLVQSPRLTPQPGLYAVSATLLPGHFFDVRFRDYFSCFRDREPDARAGQSIFIYRVEKF